MKPSKVNRLAEPAVPYFVTEKDIAIPFEGQIHCPHCNRQWFAKITPILGMGECKQLVERLLERIARHLEHRKAYGAVLDRRKHEQLVKPQ